MTASIGVPDSGADGVIAVQGGGFGGWSLYAKDGRLKYCYNFIGLELADVEDAQPLSAGPHEVRLEFAYDGGGLGKGADLTLLVDGNKVGRGRTKRSIPYLISLDETLGLGVDAGTPVTDDYARRGNEFNGAIHWVQIDLGLDDHAHLADPSQRAQVALTRQ